MFFQQAEKTRHNVGQEDQAALVSRLCAAFSKNQQLVLISGAEHRRALFPLVELLQNAGQSVVTVQLPGFGDSLLKLDSLSLDKLLTEVKRQLTERCSDNIVLIGHSMGALTALILAVDQQWKNRVTGIVLAAPAFALTDWLLHPVCWVTARLGSTKSNLLRTIWRALAPLLALLCAGILHLRYKRGQMPIRRIYQALRTNEPEDIAAGELFGTDRFPPNIGQLYLRLVFEAVAAARNVGTPVVVVDGADDRFVAQTAPAILALLRPRLHLKQPNAGHFFPAYMPEVVGKVLLALFAGDEKPYGEKTRQTN